MDYSTLRGNLFFTEVLDAGKKTGQFILRTEFGLTLFIDPMASPYVILRSYCCGKTLTQLGDHREKLFTSIYACEDCGEKLDRDGFPICPVFSLFSKSSESHLVSEWIFREIKSMDLDPVEELLASHLLARRVDEMIVDSSGNGEMEGTLQVPRYLNPDRYSDPLF